jgi:hypothetical protein
MFALARNADIPAIRFPSLSRSEESAASRVFKNSCPNQFCSHRPMPIGFE